jgi:hypothetical protein
MSVPLLPDPRPEPRDDPPAQPNHHPSKPPAGDPKAPAPDLVHESEPPSPDDGAAANSPPRKAPSGSSNFVRLKRRYGIFQGSEIGPVLRKLPSAAPPLVEGLLPRGSVNILVGDSGIGKSALAYQLGLAVAAGTPFLDLAVARGKVLMVDFENSLADAHWIMEQQRKHLGLARFPHTFQLWPMLLDPLRDKIEEVVAMFAPDLVILDSLRSFNPKMEGENSVAVAQIKRLRATAAQHGTAFLLIHHVRKHHAASHSRSPVSLEEGDVMDWLLRAAGVRAIVNQMDVRLALSLQGQRRAGSKAKGEFRSRDDAPLILRGHFRARGEVGPFLLRRKRAGDEPLGYERYTVDPAVVRDVSRDTLRKEEQEVFTHLLETFSFKDARLLHGKGYQSTNVLIHKMIRLGLVCKTGRGQYRKVGGSGERLAA